MSENKKGWSIMGDVIPFQVNKPGGVNRKTRKSAKYLLGASYNYLVNNYSSIEDLITMLRYIEKNDTPEHRHVVSHTIKTFFCNLRDKSKQ